MSGEAGRGGGGGCFRGCGGVKRREGESKGEVYSVETAMWDFSGQILEAGVWTKLQIFQLGMCIVPGRLPTTERGRERKRGRQTEKGGIGGGGEGNRGKGRENKKGVRRL